MQQVQKTQFSKYYREISQISRGSYGEVLLVQQKRGDRNLRAVKRLHLDPICEQIDQVKQLQKLKGDHIVQLYGYTREDNELNMVMHYCQGNLRDRMKKDFMFEVEQVLNLITQVTSGMLVLQKQKLVHLDLKPENILIQNMKANNYYKICDFGCSKIYKKASGTFNQNFSTVSSINNNNCVFGTSFYIAPQIQISEKQIQGTNSCDIWSMGIIIYQIIYNRHPFNVDEDGRVITQDFKDFVSGRIHIDFPETVLKYPISLVKKMLMPNPRQRISWLSIKQQLIKEYGMHEENFVNLDQVCSHTIKTSLVFANIIEDFEQIKTNLKDEIGRSLLTKLKNILIVFGYQQLVRMQRILNYKFSEKMDVSQEASYQFMKHFFQCHKEVIKYEHISTKVIQIEQQLIRLIQQILIKIDLKSKNIDKNESSELSNFLIFIKEASKVDTFLYKQKNLNTQFEESFRNYRILK